jgi:predicted nuclease of predicted toxin-antitoxin system
LRILVDESLSPKLADNLAEDGHECYHANRLGLRGQSDKVIHEAALERTAILISRDLDFSNITKFPPGSHPGLIVIRWPSQIRNRVLIEAIRTRLRTLAESDITGNTVIMEPDRTRIRRKE